MLEKFISAAHERGIKVIIFNQIQGVLENNQPYVPEGNLENYQKWLDAFGLFMHSRAAYFERIGIDLWEMGCSVCMYHDEGDGSPEAKELFSNAYSTMIDEVKLEYTGATFMNAGVDWIADRPDILAEIDYVRAGIWANIEEMPNSMKSSLDAEIYRDYLLESSWVRWMAQLDQQDKPIILNFGTQSRNNIFNYSGYVEVTGCTASIDDIFDTSPNECVQRSMEADFSLQSIITEGSFEAIKGLNMENLKMVIIGDYWETDSMYSKDLFPNLGTTFRNKPAEGIVQKWYERP
jgi:hypothetical protein